MNRPIKFRGREFFGKRHVYGQTICETDDGFDFWDGNEVYEGFLHEIPVEVLKLKEAMK